MQKSIPFTVLFYPNEILLDPSETKIYRSEFEFHLNEILRDQKKLIQLKYCLIKMINIL